MENSSERQSEKMMERKVVEVAVRKRVWYLENSMMMEKGIEEVEMEL